MGFVFAFRFVVLAFHVFVFELLPPLGDHCVAMVSKGKSAVYLLFTLCLPGLVVDKIIDNRFGVF